MTVTWRNFFGRAAGVSALIALIALIGCSEKGNTTGGTPTDSSGGGGGALTDGRDNQKYGTVKIGNQTWMSRNLNYQTPAGSWCYGDDDSYCKKYGRLYDWNTAREACPAGWHLPTREEWAGLIEEVGGSYSGGNKLKSASGWDYSEESAGTDDYGFSALPGGYRGGSDGQYDFAGSNGTWWTATTQISGRAYNRNMRFNYGGADENSNSNGSGYSVRCVKG